MVSVLKYLVEIVPLLTNTRFRCLSPCCISSLSRLQISFCIPPNSLPSKSSRSTVALFVHGSNSLPPCSVATKLIHARELKTATITTNIFCIRRILRYSHTPMSCMYILARPLRDFPFTLPGGGVSILKQRRINHRLSRLG